MGARPRETAPKDALVIGAGFAGLAIALRLRARGLDVTLLERHADLGGRARVFRRGDYIFDAGPTVITAPFLFEELFAIFGERLSDHCELLPVEPWYRMRFADGRHLDYGGTLDDVRAEIARFEPRDVAGYDALFAHSRRLYETGFERLAHVPFDRLSTMLRTIPDLVRLRADRSVLATVSRHLSDPRLRRAFSIQPLLVGGNPLTTSSLYCLIHYLERAHGVWFARGGTGALVAALADLLRRHGGRIETGATVTRLESRNRRVTGAVLADGMRREADLVVHAGDPAHLFDALLPEAASALPPWQRGRARRFSMGLFVLYFATDRTWPEVAHHTILFGERYEALLREIFGRGPLGDDLSLYLHRPAATDPGMAPPGHDTFYVLAPVPNLRGDIDWSTRAAAIRERVLDMLDATELPGLRAHLTECFSIDPTYFRDALLSVHGAGFSIAPVLTQSAWFRFHNRVPGFENLYLVGAGTHPGAGVPGVLCSAKATEAAIARASTARVVTAAP